MTYRVSGGLPQSSVLGPQLWNIGNGARSIGFANDVVVVVVAKQIEEVIQVAEEAVETIRRWLSSLGLQLTNQKTEVVLVSGRKARETTSITVGGREILSRPSLKYLGVMVDNRLRFKQHLDYIYGKPAGVVLALSRVMPNVGGPRPGGGCWPGCPLLLCCLQP